MKNFDSYYNNCMKTLLGEDNSVIPSALNYKDNTSEDVSEKLKEELQEHFKDQIKEIDIPSTISNKIKAFLWSVDKLGISVQISVIKSRIDQDYKITIKDLNKEDDSVIDIPDDHIESQIKDVVEKLNTIKNNAKGPEDTSEENDTALPSFNSVDNNPANPANPQTILPTDKAGELAQNFQTGLQT